MPCTPSAMSDAARKALTEPSEGCRLRAYQDCVHVWTIGFGHTSRAGAPVVVPGMTITAEDADAILSRDLATTEHGVAALLAGLSFDVPQHHFDALVDLAFNVGLGALKSSSLLAAYRSGDKETAARKFLDWNRAGGKVVAGLTARRRRDQAWFIYGHLAGSPLALLDEPSPDMLAQAHDLDHPDTAWLRWFYAARAPAILEAANA